MSNGDFYIGGTNYGYANKINALGDPTQVVTELLDLGSNPRGPVHKRLRRYQELVTRLIGFYMLQNETLHAQRAQIEALVGEGPTQNGKRWTEEEDTLLIERVANEEESIMNIAIAFNRSPGAITSRLTFLVGKRRVSREVVGRLTGYLDGERVEGGLFIGELADV